MIITIIIIIIIIITSTIGFPLGKRISLINCNA